MRFITLSALFLFASTTLAAPVSLSSTQDTYSNLALRDGVADTGAAIGITARSDLDDENWLERRGKKADNRVARKARNTAVKAEVAQARQKGINKYNIDVAKKHGRAATRTPDHVKAAHKVGINAAQAKKLELHKAAQVKRKQLEAAGNEHRRTTGGLPGRNQKFTVAAGNGKPERTYTGKDVRKANFASHIKNSAGKPFGKPFKNDVHHDPGTSGTTKPIPHMVGPGHEHPLSGATTFSQMKKDQTDQPARIVSQSTATGHTHMGVIAHDQSRTLSHPGKDDHFLINPT